ncbi:Flagellar hook-basal body complex protein FliE [hydrothermal vent metagenome]|uniref:Flagellar hook-basal body complex protein FliE n=1 Tax=hydrothermal vent metagenome TaxID=652676 RepID=A0A3B1AJ22_9ZZZZ
MNTIDINQVLTQIRTLEAQAKSEAPALEQGAGAGFSDLLVQSIEQVNDVQQKAGALKTAFEAGDPNVDLANVMIAVQKSSVSFQAMVQVRNKLVAAYKDVMSMPL